MSLAAAHQDRGHSWGQARLCWNESPGLAKRPKQCGQGSPEARHLTRSWNAATTAPAPQSQRGEEAEAGCLQPLGRRLLRNMEAAVERELKENLEFHLQGKTFRNEGEIEDFPTKELGAPSSPTPPTGSAAGGPPASAQHGGRGPRDGVSDTFLVSPL